MNISIKATNLTLTPAVKKYAKDKVGMLEKYISAMEAKVELERDRKHHSGMVFRAEVSIVVGGKLMLAEASGEDIYAAIDLVIPKIKEQIAKFKDKRETLQKRGARAAKRRN